MGYLSKDGRPSPRYSTHCFTPTLRHSDPARDVTLWYRAASCLSANRNSAPVICTRVVTRLSIGGWRLEVVYRTKLVQRATSPQHTASEVININSKILKYHDGKIPCSALIFPFSRRIHGRYPLPDKYSSAVCVLPIKLAFRPIYILHNQCRCRCPP